jgi:hypothetical protein
VKLGQKQVLVVVKLGVSPSLLGKFGRQNGRVAKMRKYFCYRMLAGPSRLRLCALGR